MVQTSSKWKNFNQWQAVCPTYSFKKWKFHCQVKEGNRWPAVWEVAEETGISSGSCQWKCGLQEHWTLNTKTQQFTQLYQLKTSWQSIQFLSFHITPIHLTSPLHVFSTPMIKSYLKRKKISNVIGVITNKTNELRAISQTSFRQCF